MKNILTTIKEIETTTISSPVVERTIQLAAAFSSKTHIIHVAPPEREPIYNVDRDLFKAEIISGLREKQSYLENVAAQMRAATIDVTPLLERGPIIKTIIREADRLSSDLIIIGRDKHGPLFKALMDHTDKGLLAKSNCPIMFVPV